MLAAHHQRRFVAHSRHGTQSTHGNGCLDPRLSPFSRHSVLAVLRTTKPHSACCEILFLFVTRSIDDVYGSDAPSATGARASKRSCGGRVHSSGGGSFQKASVDEAYLEPARRTLTAELLSSKQHEGRPAAIGKSDPTASTGTSATVAERLVAGVKRPRAGGNSASVAGHGDGSSWDPVCSMQRRGLGESQYGDAEGDRHDWNMAVGYGSSLDDDEQSDEWGRKRRREHDAVRDIGEDEDRLLEAGGLLGKRIQKTLRDVLNYDCSVGVASNKVRTLQSIRLGLLARRGALSWPHWRDCAMFCVSLIIF